jgi:hypothetical protein
VYLIWGLLNDLSVIMDLALISVNVPGTASTIQSIILNLIYLDILQTSSWLEAAIIEANTAGNDDQSLNVYFNNSGFGSKLLLINLGSTLIYLGVLIAAFALYYILAFFSKYHQS